MSAPSAEPMPDELSPRRIGRRMLQLAIVGLAITGLIIVGPGLGELRRRLDDAALGWVLAGVGLEVLSALCYVVIFRAVFCPRMSWRLSYQIGMAEQGANSVLSVSGAGGLALGAWALHRGGMNTEHIARRTVAFFFLTSLANVGGVILFAVLYALGLLGNDPDRALTYGFGAAALAATGIVLALPRLLARAGPAPDPGPERGLPGLPAREGAAPAQAPERVTGTLRRALQFVEISVGQGVRDGVELLRQRSIGVLVGSIGTMAFDLAVLGVCFRAFHHSAPVGVLVLGYLIGQLGGNLPVPGGIGGLDGGLIASFALYHQPLAATAAAVLVYHAISLWVPGLMGSVAFLRLRGTLRRESQPAAMCMPLAEPVEVVTLPTTPG